MRVLLAVVVAVLLVAGAALLIVSRDGGGEGEPAPAGDTATGGEAGQRQSAEDAAGRDPAEATPGVPAAPVTAKAERERLLSLIESSDLDPAQKATLRDALGEVEGRPELLEPLARRLNDELGE